MLNYILKKIGYGLVVLIMVVCIVSTIISLAPVDPAELTFGNRYDEETVKAKREALGLDKGIFTQLWMYLKDLSPISVVIDNAENKAKYKYTKLLLIGEQALILKAPYLRESFQSGRRVSEILGEAIPLTAILALTSIFLATIIGIFLGIIASLKPNTFFDNFAITISVLGYSVPSYVSAMILALVFGFFLSEYTGLNVQGSLIVLDDFGEEQYVWKNLILPAIALGIRPVAIITQLTRSAMLDVLSQDYIRTAKAKGLPKRTVIVRHALRNALNPVTTAISGWFAALLAGAFFVENVFNFKGLGDVAVNALLSFDIPVVLGAVVFTAVLFVLVNLIVDIVYIFLDPRIAVS